MPTDVKIIEKCLFCDTEFQFGPNQYDGKYSPTYEAYMCQICWDGCWDGLNRDYEEIATKHLEKLGSWLPERNEQGLFPRE